MGTRGQLWMAFFNSLPPWLLSFSFIVCVCTCMSMVMYIIHTCECSGSLVCFRSQRRVLSILLYHCLPYCLETQHRADDQQVPLTVRSLLLDSAGVSLTGDHTRLYMCSGDLNSGPYAYATELHIVLLT